MTQGRNLRAIGKRKKKQAVTGASTIELPEFAVVDGRRVVLRGYDEIVFECGEASITLRRNGRIILKGTDIVVYSAGANRIKGALVDIG